MAAVESWGVPDVTQLIQLSEESVLENLRERYEHDEIHTFTGNILLIINPYKRLPVYDAECMELFKGRRINRAPPHVYAIAEESYHRLRREGVSQAIIVSGESGAGKTETNKYLMKYLMWRAQSEESSGHLARAILHSNPILEAFGNAKTGRNHNSSRFGKFVKLHVGSYGAVEGAVVSTYLLEKSRVSLHGPGERNYHIFYQLQAGASPAERVELQLLGSPSDYRYLSQGGPGALTVPGVDDSMEFEATRDAMAFVGVGAEEQAHVLRLVAALMHLGCVTFANTSEDVAAVSNPGFLDSVNDLLGIEDVSPLLLERKMKVPGAELNIALTAHQAAGARDAFSKAFYDLLFRYLTRTINIALVDSAEECDFLTPFVGLLDVYGFEIFEKNSFEQLCINFVNEKLHQFFLSFVFKMESVLYAEECVPSGHIEYEDNQGCIDLVEKAPTGILKLLDSQCITPQATDGNFCAQVNEVHRNHPFLAKPRHASGKHAQPNAVFVVRHFAGDVVYHPEGFLQKNNDALDPFFKTAMESSRSPLLRALLDISAGGGDGGANSKGRGKHGGRGGGWSSAFNSLGKRFLGEMSQLLEVLNASGAHFIRCMKPNMRFAMGVIDVPTILRQLHANGTLEAVRLMRNGYPIRVPFELLHSRYLPLLESDVPAVRDLTPAQFCELIAAVVGVAAGDFVCGTTRIFLRGDAGAAFEELKDKDPEEVVPILKAKVAEWEAKAKAIDRLWPWLVMWIYRSKYVRWRRGALRIQARVRGGWGRAQAHLALLQAHAERQRLKEIRRTQGASLAGGGQPGDRAARLSLVLLPPNATYGHGGGMRRNNRDSAVSETTTEGDTDRWSDAEDTVTTDFTERSELEAMLTQPQESVQEEGEDGGDPGAAGGGVGVGVRAGTAKSPAPKLPPLSLPVQKEVQKALATRDYAMMEQEMRALISKIRAEAALKEAQLLQQIKSQMKKEQEDRVRERLAGGDSLTQRFTRITPAILSRLRGATTSRRQEEAADDEDDDPVKYAVLRPTRNGSHHALELVVLEEGSVLPLFKKVLKQSEVDRAREVFETWDSDRDGAIALSEFLFVMQRMAERQGKPTDPRKIQAMFQVADIDGDGQVDFAEFLVMQVRRQHREAGQPTMQIPEGRRLSRRASSRSSVKEAGSPDHAANAPRQEAARPRPQTFGELVLHAHRRSEPMGKVFVSEDEFRRLVAQVHEDVLGEPVAESRWHALLTMADAAETGRVDLERFADLPIVNAHFGPLPAPSPPQASIGPNNDTPSATPEPPSGGGGGAGDNPRTPRLPNGKIPLPGSDKEPEFQRKPKGGHSRSGVVTGEKPRTAREEKQLVQKHTARVLEQSRAAAEEERFRKEEAEAQQRRSSALRSGRQKGSQSERSLSAASARNQPPWDTADTRAASTTSVRPANAFRRAAPKGAGDAGSRQVERKSSFPRISIPKLSFGRKGKGERASAAR